MSPKKWTQEMLYAVQSRHEEWLMEQPGVKGVGVASEGKGPLVLEVLTDHMEDAVRRTIQQRLRGIPLQFTETGPIEAL